ncbi:hypothetical protein M5G17_27295, partial [Pseudomonas sp. TNT2022 ID1025]|nr:hypothetical protein [Pseudomonas rubra]MDD1157338.1 hypothetical protein [Pseudomonas rubra]
LFGASLMGGFAALTVCSASLASVGTDTATMLTEYFNRTVEHCDTPSTPAFSCSGILLRSTLPPTTAQATWASWYSSPNAKKKGGMAFSYLRADTQVTRLAGRGLNGYTLYPTQDIPSGKKQYEVLCAYPSDGDTGTRTQQGCGDNSKTRDEEQLCETTGIDNAAQWVVCDP